MEYLLSLLSLSLSLSLSLPLSSLYAQQAYPGGESELFQYREKLKTALENCQVAMTIQYNQLINFIQYIENIR